MEGSRGTNSNIDLWGLSKVNVFASPQMFIKHPLLILELQK